MNHKLKIFLFSIVVSLSSLSFALSDAAISRQPIVHNFDIFRDQILAKVGKKNSELTPLRNYHISESVDTDGDGLSDDEDPYPFDGTRPFYGDLITSDTAQAISWDNGTAQVGSQFQHKIQNDSSFDISLSEFIAFNGAGVQIGYTNDQSLLGGDGLLSKDEVTSLTLTLNDASVGPIDLVYYYINPEDQTGETITARFNADTSQVFRSYALDTDGDGEDNNTDDDDDGDSVSDGDDAFPLDATESVDTDSDGIGNNADTDDDGDSVLDGDDAFPLDATESVDTDGDGVGDNSDWAPEDSSESADTDGDGIGNNADVDDDNDGVLDVDDALPLDANETVDTDGDGVGDNSDWAPEDSSESADTDGDGVGDNSDWAPEDSSESADTDGDGVGNNADEDDDNDGVADSDDAFPLDKDASVDTDGDGLADSFDLSTAQYTEINSFTTTVTEFAGPIEVFSLEAGQIAVITFVLDDYPSECSVVFDGITQNCSAIEVTVVGEHSLQLLDSYGDGGSSASILIEQVIFPDATSAGTFLDNDDDNDGILDAEDGFPLIDLGGLTDTDSDGRPNECDTACVDLGMSADNDDDNDGVPDSEDGFPLIDLGGLTDTDSDGRPNECDTACVDLGMSADNDDDNDGVLDVDDFFPLNKLEQFDSDGDGVGDNADFLPGDSRESSDIDNDGIGDNSDNCVNMMNTFQEDLDQDGLGDACDDVFSPDPDGDGYTHNDLFPFDASEALDSDGDGIGDNSDEDWLYPENGKNGSSVNFQVYDFVPVNLGANAIYTSTGKLNADSKDDLLIVCGNGCGQIISFTSNANETWNLNLVSETLDVPTSAFIADIDGDSDSDILATNYRDNGGVYYFESVAGAIDPDPVIINSDFYGAKSVKAYDFDKDGDQDLVYASSWHNEVVFEKQLSSSTTKITLSTEVWGVNNLILIDYNRDSWMDIMAVAENSGELIYFENSKNGQFKAKETIFEEEGYLRDATITDYDADGDLDIFAATSGSFGRAGLMLYERVSGSLERQVIDNTSMLFKYPIEAFPKNIISSDFDNDGDLDLFVEFSNSNAAFYEKSSSGVFSDPKLVLGFTYNQSVIGSYELSDYDNDGDDDLWWVSSPFGISIFENTCSDIDSDGICDAQDNDQDGDSLSNEEELLLGLDPRNNDSDRDGVDDALDDFPLNLLETTDTDGDGVGDNADLFPNNINEFQDFDLDGIGNNTDDDDDNDGIADVDDAFPFNPGEWSDTDLDGIGDRRDLDDDGDGVNDIDDLFPLDLTEAYDSDDDGVGDNGDVFPDDPNESLDTDSDGIGNNADADDDNDGFSDEQELIDGTDPLSKFSCREGCASLDLDGSEKYDALTDGLLLLRGMFGLDGSALTTGTIAADAIYTSSVDITTRINDLGSAADIDGNGDIDALTDGLLTLRYLFGLEGDTLINGVVASDATRTTAEEIEAHLETLMPAL